MFAPMIDFLSSRDCYHDILAAVLFLLLILDTFQRDIVIKSGLLEFPRDL